MLANTLQYSACPLSLCYPGVTNQQHWGGGGSASDWSVGHNPGLSLAETWEGCCISWSPHVLHKFRGKHFPTRGDPGLSNVTGTSLSPANHRVWADNALSVVTWRVTGAQTSGVSTGMGGTCALSHRGKRRGKLYNAGTIGIRGSNEFLTNVAVISCKLASWADSANIFIIRRG